MKKGNKNGMKGKGKWEFVGRRKHSTGLKKKGSPQQGKTKRNE